MTPVDPKRLRAVRVDDLTWQLAQDTADADGVTLSDVIRTALQAYGRGIPWRVPSAPTRTIRRHPRDPAN